MATDLPQTRAASHGAGSGWATTPRGSAARSFTLREALRTSAFYLICADNVVGCILGAGVFFHLIPIIRENGGGDVNIALALTLPMGVTEAAASLCIGRLIDKQMPPRFILGFTNLLQMCITLVFPYLLRQTFLLILSPFRPMDLFCGAGT